MLLSDYLYLYLYLDLYLCSCNTAQKETLLNQVQLFLIHEGYMKLYRQIQGVKGVERAQEAFFVCSGCGFGSIEKVAKSSQVHCIVWWGGPFPSREKFSPLS